jgi:hypothetical protein
MLSRTDQAAREVSWGVDPLQGAVEYGIDVCQLWDNLALSVVERLRRHQIPLNTVELLWKAKRLEAPESTWKKVW